MPIMDGCTATSIIRKELGYKGYILGYTAWSNTNEILSCYEHGMDNVLSKPTKADEILNVI